MASDVMGGISYPKQGFGPKIDYRADYLGDKDKSFG